MKMGLKKINKKEKTKKKGRKGERISAFGRWKMRGEPNKINKKKKEEKGRESWSLGGKDSGGCVFIFYFYFFILIISIRRLC